MPYSFQKYLPVIQCAAEGPRSNVVILNSRATYSFGESIYYSCKDGYKLIGPKSRKCEKNLDGSGRWNGYNPLCEGKHFDLFCGCWGFRRVAPRNITKMFVQQIPTSDVGTSLILRIII